MTGRTGADFSSQTAAQLDTVHAPDIVVGREIPPIPDSDVDGCREDPAFSLYR
jgi:hypothetical protein